MTPGFKYLEHTSDIYIEAFGSNLSEAFEQAGLAFYDTMTDLSSIDSVIEENIILRSDDLKTLLYKFIEELLFIFDTKFLLFRIIKVKIDKCNGEYKLQATLKGDQYSEQKHKLKVGIKAATYSLMEIIETKKSVRLRFVMDI